MEAKHQQYVRDPDDDLRDIGVRITDHTKEIPMEAETEVLDGGASFLNGIKYPALFLGLVIGIGVCEYLGLMAEVIAVPAMCVCSACFGGNVKK